MASVPNDSGTIGYLIRSIPATKLIFERQNEDLELEEKLKVIRKLIMQKRLGWRGHLVFEIGVLVAIAIMLGNVHSCSRQDTLPASLTCLFGIVFGLGITLYEFFYYHWTPKENLVKNAIADIKKARMKK